MRKIKFFVFSAIFAATISVYGETSYTITGDMPNYNSDIATPWYYQRENIKTFRIENGITSIGIYAFYNCSSSTQIHNNSVVPQIIDWSGF